jgi:hypothetical protein
MKIFRLGGYALNSCVAIALLAGCGQPQLPSGASLNEATRVGNTESKTFHYTGQGQQFRVPAGVHKITVDAWGAAGAASDTPGGNGGRVSATIPVTPGEKLFVFVGGTSGFNGGADGGTSSHYPKGCLNDCAGGGGGGASDIRLDGSALGDRVFVAGGGGGAGGDDYSYSSGSSGAGPLGGGGGRRIGGRGRPAKFGAHGGGGGTQSKGGHGGAGGPGIYHGDEGQSGTRGTLADGGAGGYGVPYGYVAGGGGGGGGYYGGGGGGGGGGWPSSGVVPGGGGGGGSPYVESSATNVHMWQGWKGATGDGLVILSWD